MKLENLAKQFNITLVFFNFLINIISSAYELEVFWCTWMSNN